MDVVYGAANAYAGRVWVSLGSHWRADDPVVLAHPSLFSPDPTTGMSYSTPPVAPARVYVGPQPDPEPSVHIEQATAAPGEQRNTVRPDSQFAELVALRERARVLGVEVDNRWGVGRLEREIEAAGGVNA